VAELDDDIESEVESIPEIGVASGDDHNSE
jgi:hypothetical protein